MFLARSLKTILTETPNSTAMKTIKQISLLLMTTLLMTSCYVDVIDDGDYVVVEPDPTPALTLNQYLQTYELWYLDVEQTTGNARVPFLDIAFTLSFMQGDVFANNNLVGIGSRGNGFGIQVGYYDTFEDIVEISHDKDGFHRFEIIQGTGNRMVMRDIANGTRYVFYGYDRNTFDYDLVFYNNIHYFMQEYDLWEKTSTSTHGDVNPFDEENFIQFLPFGQGDNFQSSIDAQGTHPNDVVWDYEGHYEVTDITNDSYLKGLYLDYLPMGNEYFEISIPNDATLSLYHPASATTYTFRGRGFIQYKLQGDQSKAKKRYTKAEFKALTKEQAK